MGHPAHPSLHGLAETWTGTGGELHSLGSVGFFLLQILMQSTLRMNHNIELAARVARQIHVYWPEYNCGKFRQLLAFGPNYRATDSPFWKRVKEEALQHVLDKSECSFSELMNTIGSIEGEARAAYANDLSNMTGVEFQVMMAEDGCLFLLLAFSILGAGTQLKFRENHLVFGIGYATEKMTKWLASMFFVGNQVPFVVLETLMNLRFFQELKATRQWKQPLELAKRTLYKFLMVGQNPNPVDLIHCLQSIMLGIASDSNGATSKMLDDKEGISSASRLSEQGVQFEKLDGELGSRRISYKCSRIDAVLYLPVFRVDRHTKLMVECLRKYEIVQESRGIEPEASSYFKLLKDLIRTPQDLEVLSSCGVIQGQADSLQELLRNFDCAETSWHLCQVRKQIKEDPPLQWRKFTRLIVKFIMVLSSCLLLVLTYLQAHYTLVGYYYRKG